MLMFVEIRQERKGLYEFSQIMKEAYFRQKAIVNFTIPDELIRH